MVWEYRITSLNMSILKGPSKDAVPTMNKLGEDGWELVGVCPHITANGGVSEMTLFWKRAVGEVPQP